MVQAGGIQVAPQRAAEIRDSVLDELRGEREQAAADRARASQRLATLTSERKAVLQAHYAGAYPSIWRSALLGRNIGPHPGGSARGVLALGRWRSGDE